LVKKVNVRVIRPVQLKDLDQLVKLSYQASFGLTSLPKGRKLLRKRILESIDSFARTSQLPRGELFVFVLEDIEKRLILGTSSIVSKLGGFQPFYSYRVDTYQHESKELKVRKQIDVLHLVREHDGPAEIGGLFLKAQYRKHGTGRLLSLFRFLFMAEQRSRFESTVIAEMRGVVDEQGRSPFWETLGSHFFDIDYPTADYLTQVDKKFIADLMPKFPIYIPLLPKSAQEVIGKVHERTKPALEMLKAEGFQYAGMIDIFEAGPVMQCKLDKIRIVRQSRKKAIAEITAESIESVPFIITNTQQEFRACIGSVAANRGKIRVTKETAELLQVAVGDRVRFSPMRPPKPASGGK
jgi:arginine N-succinyltransferase